MSRFIDGFTTPDGREYRKLLLDDLRIVYTRDGRFISRQTWAGAQSGPTLEQVEEARQNARDFIARSGLQPDGEPDPRIDAELEAIFWDVFREIYGKKE